MKLEFPPRRWDNGHAKYLHSECYACRRTGQRREFEPVAVLTTNAQSLRKTYNRGVKRRQRRQAGVPEKGARVRARANFPDSVPREPFAEWLREKVEKYGTIELVAEATGTNSRQIRRILSGYETSHGKIRAVDYVTLSKVDAMLVAEGSTMLWELYPDD